MELVECNGWKKTVTSKAAAAAATVAAAKSRRRRRRVTCKMVRMKVRKLQKLIPGGEGLKADRLFLRTADYILHLRSQVNVLQALANIYKP